MNFALFGGTFDPIHKGHMTVAQAVLADPRFALERVYFVPADWPPHKKPREISAYSDRYAMVELAIADEPKFVASEIDAAIAGASEPNYSINTVKRFKATLAPEDQLYFIVGADSFRDIRSWREPLALLRACKFIVVNRPGVKLDEALRAAPEGAPAENIFVIESIAEDVSSTEIRAAIAKGRPLEDLVPAAVAQYIRERHLYV
jgi:nicotinate-nucleotide adenylyltransferase